MSTTTPIIARLPYRHPERTRSLVAGLARVWAGRPLSRELVRLMSPRATRGTPVPSGARGRLVDPWLRDLHRWVRDRVRFEPEQGEVIQTPGVTIGRGAGDCDDKTLLVGFACEVMGARWRALLLASHPERFGELRSLVPGAPWDGWRPFHIWPQVDVAGEWVDVETCHPRGELDEHPAEIIRRLGRTF